jgi:hypothetical protein
MAKKKSKKSTKKKSKKKANQGKVIPHGLGFEPFLRAERDVLGEFESLRSKDAMLLYVMARLYSLNSGGTDPATQYVFGRANDDKLVLTLLTPKMGCIILHRNPDNSNDRKYVSNLLKAMEAEGLLPESDIRRTGPAGNYRSVGRIKKKVFWPHTLLVKTTTKKLTKKTRKSTKKGSVACFLRCELACKVRCKLASKLRCWNKQGGNKQLLNKQYVLITPTIKAKKSGGDERTKKAGEEKGPPDSDRPSAPDNPPAQNNDEGKATPPPDVVTSPLPEIEDVVIDDITYANKWVAELEGDPLLQGRKPTPELITLQLHLWRRTGLTVGEQNFKSWAEHALDEFSIIEDLDVIVIRQLDVMEWMTTAEWDPSEHPTPKSFFGEQQEWLKFENRMLGKSDPQPKPEINETEKPVKKTKEAVDWAEVGQESAHKTASSQIYHTETDDLEVEVAALILLCQEKKLLLPSENLLGEIRKAWQKQKLYQSRVKKALFYLRAKVGLLEALLEHEGSQTDLKQQILRGIANYGPCCKQGKEAGKLARGFGIRKFIGEGHYSDHQVTRHAAGTDEQSLNSGIQVEAECL